MRALIWALVALNVALWVAERYARRRLRYWQGQLREAKAREAAADAWGDPLDEELRYLTKGER